MEGLNYIDKKGEVTFYSNSEGKLFQQITICTPFPVDTETPAFKYIASKHGYEIKYCTDGISGYCIFIENTLVSDKIWTLKQADEKLLGLPEPKLEPVHGKSYIFHQDDTFFEAKVDGNKLNFQNGFDDIRYLKGAYKTEDNFKKCCLNIIQKNTIRFYNIELDFTELLKSFKKAKPFSYSEAIDIQNQRLRNNVLKTISNNL